MTDPTKLLPLQYYIVTCYTVDGRMWYSEGALTPARDRASLMSELQAKECQAMVAHDRRMIPQQSTQVTITKVPCPEPILVSMSDQFPILIGILYADFRCEMHRVTGWSAPRHAGSTGRVHTDHGSYYPSVIGAEWINRTDQG